MSNLRKCPVHGLTLRAWRPLWTETLAAAALGLLVVAIVASFLAGCGGDPFSSRLDDVAALVALDAAADAGAGEVLEESGIRSYTNGSDAGDAGEVLDGHQSAPDRFTLVHDAAAEVLEVLEASRIDTAPELDAGDAGDVPTDAGTQVPEAAPPAALCCDTPCSGGQVAAITCGNGPPWTCGDPSGPSCSSARCSVGSLCYWQGASCSGRVAVCP